MHKKSFSFRGRKNSSPRLPPWTPLGDFHPTDPITSIPPNLKSWICPCNPWNICIISITVCHKFVIMSDIETLLTQSSIVPPSVPYCVFIMWGERACFGLQPITVGTVGFNGICSTQYCKTCYFCCILMLSFLNIEILRHFNFALFCFPSAVLVFTRPSMAKLNFHGCIRNFAILSCFQNLRRFRACKLQK